LTLVGAVPSLVHAIRFVDNLPHNCVYSYTCTDVALQVCDQPKVIGTTAIAWCKCVRYHQFLKRVDEPELPVTRRAECRTIRYSIRYGLCHFFRRKDGRYVVVPYGPDRCI